jgi:hypothetical protein
MGIDLLQLHIFTLQLFEEMELQQDWALRSIWLLIANADSGYSKIIFKLLAFAWQLAYWGSIDANTQTFLLWTPTWIPSLIGLLVLHQQNLGDHFSSRNLYALMIWSSTSLLQAFFFFLHSRNLTGTLPHLKRMRVELLILGDLNSLKYLITRVLRGLLLMLLLEQAAEKWLTQGWFWDNLLLIFSSLSSFHYFFLFSLTLSFSLLFPLENSIKEYYHHTEEETKDSCTTVFNPRITKHCDLRGGGVENGVVCDLAEGIYLECALLWARWELRELVGGGLSASRGAQGGVEW